MNSTQLVSHCVDSAKEIIYTVESEKLERVVNIVRPNTLKRFPRIVVLHHDKQSSKAKQPVSNPDINKCKLLSTLLSPPKCQLVKSHPHKEKQHRYEILYFLFSLPQTREIF